MPTDEYFLYCKTHSHSPRSCPEGYRGTRCEIRIQEPGGPLIIPAIISMGVGLPLGLLFCTLCLCLAVLRRRRKNREKKQEIIKETLHRYLNEFDTF